MRQTRASAKVSLADFASRHRTNGLQRQRKSDDDDDYKPSGSKKPRDTQQSERKASGKKRKSARNEGKSAEVQPTSSDPATDSPGSVWSAADVQTIGSELAQNKSWPEIQQDHFPNRTPEACKDYYDLVMKIRPENDPIGSVPQRSPNTNSSNEPEDGTEVYEAVEIPLIPSNTPTGNQQSNSNGEPEDEPMVYEGEKLPSIQPDPLTGNQQSILSSNTPTPGK